MTDLDEMKKRALCWVAEKGNGEIIVTRANAINEENLALDVLALVARVCELEALVVEACDIATTTYHPYSDGPYDRLAAIRSEVSP